MLSKGCVLGSLLENIMAGTPAQAVGSTAALILLDFCFIQFIYLKGCVTTQLLSFIINSSSQRHFQIMDDNDNDVCVCANLQTCLRKQ